MKTIGLTSEMITDLMASEPGVIKKLDEVKQQQGFDNLALVKCYVTEK